MFGTFMCLQWSSVFHGYVLAKGAAEKCFGQKGV